jgi:protein-L-isoaspartate(D-aspartate) O-methyltransferase
MRNNYDTARSRLVQEQLLPRGITDPNVIRAMQTVPRHMFIDDALHGQAYGDFALPIGEGQTISQPYIVAVMTQALALSPTSKILEIGTGCGYQTAILSLICEKVYTVERIKPLYIKARRNFDRLHYLNILCKIDDGSMGWPEYAPYDAIIVTAAGPQIPSALTDQLADPGIMVLPVGERHSQELVIVRKQDGAVTQEVIEQVRFVRLIGEQGWQS